MSDFPLIGNASEFVSYGEDLSTTELTVLTSGGLNTKGSWVELVASSEDVSEIIIHARSLDNGGANRHFIDIGIGAAASEEVLISNIYTTSGQAALDNADIYRFPIKIADGQRISARTQSGSVAAGTSGVVIFSGKRNFFASTGGAEVISLGANTTTTVGVDVDAGASADTKGAWAEITSSLSDDIKGLSIGTGNNQNPFLSQNSFFFDIGIGGAGSEEVIVNNIFVNTGSRESMHDSSHFYPISIPSGTRVAVRSQSSTTDGTARILDAILYGVR